MLRQPHYNDDEDGAKVVKETEAVKQQRNNLCGKVVVVYKVNGTCHVLRDSICHSVVHRRKTIDGPRYDRARHVWMQGKHDVRTILSPGRRHILSLSAYVCDDGASVRFRTLIPLRWTTQVV